MAFGFFPPLEQLLEARLKVGRENYGVENIIGENTGNHVHLINTVNGNV
jgi:hypothetical protein